MLEDIGGLGKTLIIIGLILVIAGILITLGPRISWLGRLPGDIYVKRENVSFYFPVTTSIIVSIILTVIIYLISRR
ncbi:MAG: DUF2905 domain-containing protein [Thermodesulfobacteriota bacterium]